jgi:hypothetical protein
MAHLVPSDVAGIDTMGLGAEAKLAVKAGLCDRIDRLAMELPHMKPGALAFAVDDIRRIARANDLSAVAELARGLENAIAESSGATVVLPFLEAMSDAVSCDSMDPAIAQSFLASVGLRLHG